MARVLMFQSQQIKTAKYMPRNINLEKERKLMGTFTGKQEKGRVNESDHMHN
jgi:hypothetical protein